MILRKFEIRTASLSTSVLLMESDVPNECWIQVGKERTRLTAQELRELGSLCNGYNGGDYVRFTEDSPESNSKTQEDKESAIKAAFDTIYPE